MAPTELGKRPEKWEDRISSQFDYIGDEFEILYLDEEPISESSLKRFIRSVLKEDRERVVKFIKGLRL